MTWHLDAPTFERYRDGLLDRGAAASVEAHVTACETCRALVPVDPVREEAAWSAVFPRVASPPLGLPERLLRSIGVPDHVARLVVLPRATGRSWFFATAAALAFAMLTARMSVGETPGVWLLITAPLAPVLGVATAYGRRISPSYDLELAAPLEAFRLLLLRSVTVTSVAMVLALIADVASPGAGWMGAWLLPSLALVVATLAIGTRTSLMFAAASVTGAWLAAVILATTTATVTVVFGTIGQLSHLVILLLAGAVLARRSGAFDQGATA